MVWCRRRTTFIFCLTRFTFKKPLPLQLTLFPYLISFDLFGIFLCWSSLDCGFSLSDFLLDSFQFFTDEFCQTLLVDHAPSHFWSRTCCFVKDQWRPGGAVYAEPQTAFMLRWFNYWWIYQWDRIVVLQCIMNNWIVSSPHGSSPVALYNDCTSVCTNCVYRSYKLRPTKWSPSSLYLLGRQNFV